MEPPPSVPIAAGTRPAATPATAPPEEPPGVSRLSHGLRVTPKRSFFVYPSSVNSGTFVFPIITAPAARNRATGSSSRSGVKSAKARLPQVAGMPATNMLSLTDRGTPSSAERGAPAAKRASLSSAAFLAPASSRKTKLLSFGSIRRILSKQSSSNAAAVSSRPRNCSANSAIVRVIKSSRIALQRRPNGGGQLRGLPHPREHGKRNKVRRHLHDIRADWHAEALQSQFESLGRAKHKTRRRRAPRRPASHNQCRKRQIAATTSH